MLTGSRLCRLYFFFLEYLYSLLKISYNIEIVLRKLISIYILIITREKDFNTIAGSKKDSHTI